MVYIYGCNRSPFDMLNGYMDPLGSEDYTLPLEIKPANNDKSSPHSTRIECCVIVKRFSGKGSVEIFQEG